MASNAPQTLVVGGGLVGTAMALGIAQTGVPVGVVEPNPPQLRRGRLGVDIRNVALNPRSRNLLGELDVWPSISAQPYSQMCVWEQWGTGKLQFSASSAGRTELGWIVEHSMLAEALWAQAQAHPDVELIEDQVVGVQIMPTGVELRLHQASAPVAVSKLFVADGAQSQVRTLLGESITHHETGQCALATVVRTQDPHNETAWQRFIRGGPIALLPSLTPHIVSVVWTHPEAQVARYADMSEPDFLRAITSATEHCLGDVLEVDSRYVFPLRQQVLSSHLQDPRVCYLGDALRVVHPLAGLGVNLGYEDVDTALAVWRREGGDGAWRRWHRHRLMRSRMVIELMRSLESLYGSAAPSVGLMRNVGVRTLERLPGLKRQIMQEAMGLGPIARMQS